MKNLFKLMPLFAIATLAFTPGVHAQVLDSIAGVKRTNPADTSRRSLNMDATYNRPMLAVGKAPVAVGGYLEANYQYNGTDGITAGHEFQFRRLTVFLASGIGRRLRFLSELEMEGDEPGNIAVEFAALDIELHPLATLRGGVIVNPIGAFNQNHDGPKWEFIDRPISSTQMLPATFSNAGFGVYGRHYRGLWMLGYELYATGGFDGSIIHNETGRTSLPATKGNRSRLVTSSSGTALVTAKTAFRHRRVGELGLSYMGGTYNAWTIGGLVVDKKRRVDIFAVDITTTLPSPINTTLIGEAAVVRVDVPPAQGPAFGGRQQGGFIDVVQPIRKGRLLGWENTTINLAVRTEYVDWNVATFAETNQPIGDQLWSVVPGLSLRFSPLTVVRLNYRYQKTRDLFNNPAATTAGVSVGFSTYF